MDQNDLRAAAELRRKRGTDCFVAANGGWVDYHKTRVVWFDKKTILLNHGGWKTVTSKRRMNQASEAFGLGFRVYQDDYRWYVDYNGTTFQFNAMQLLLRRGHGAL